MDKNEWEKLLAFTRLHEKGELNNRLAKRPSYAALPELCFLQIQKK